MSKACFKSVTIDIKCLAEKMDNNKTTEFFSNLTNFMKEQGFSWSGQTGQCEVLTNGFFRLGEKIHFISE